MRRNPRNGSAIARLAEVNPVPASERDRLVARLNEIKPELPQLGLRQRKSWRKASIVPLTLALVLAIGGVGIAASWSPLSTIGAADRPAEPTDTLSAADKEMLRRIEIVHEGWVSPIGKRLVDQARLLGTLPNGHNVFAVPTSKDKLCIYVAEYAASCGDPLTETRPITMTVSKPGPAVPAVVWGATTNNVVSVSFEFAGRSVTVPVQNNFYAWEGPPEAAQRTISAATVTFTDGTSAPAK